MNVAPGIDLRANLDKNQRGRDARDYIDQRHRECEERESFDVPRLRS
jgi:hypothetical protein